MKRRALAASALAILFAGACASGNDEGVATYDVLANPNSGVPPTTPGVQPAPGTMTGTGTPGTQTPGTQTPGTQTPTPSPQTPPGETPDPGTESPGMTPIAGSGSEVPTEDPVEEPATMMPPPGDGPAPTVPAVTATCPQFRSGTINFMGLGGIRMEAGSKASSASAPMVFYWHGTGSTAGEFALMAGAVHQGVVSEGGVLISFQGTTGGDLLSGTAIFGAGDFELADQLFACAVQDHNVDARRVYATGCSAGGLFSGAMAAMRSSYMAAVAPNSGGWTTPVVRWENDYTPALMTIHGAAGRDVVIIDFSDSSRTADTAFKQRGGFVINCDHGGGHCGGGGFAGDIWEFFKAHPYGTTTSPWQGGLPGTVNSDCQIF